MADNFTATPGHADGGAECIVHDKAIVALVNNPLWICLAICCRTRRFNGNWQSQQIAWRGYQRLLVGTGDEIGNAFVVLNGVEGLAPVDLSPLARRSQLDGQGEVISKVCTGQPVPASGCLSSTCKFFVIRTQCVPG